MRAIDEPARIALLRLSATLCATSLLLAPLAGRSALELRAEQGVFNERLNPPELHADENAVVAIARDPFAAPRPRATADTTQTAVSSAEAVVPAMLEVRAVITGAQPHALVDDAGKTRMVQPGDSLAGARVVSIDAAGVRLDNGVLLALRQVMR